MLPPEWLPTSSTGPSAGMFSRPRTSAAEVEAREQPQPGQLLADVVGVALVEVGLGDARLHLASPDARLGDSDASPAGRASRGPPPVAALDPLRAARRCWLGAARVVRLRDPRSCRSLRRAASKSSHAAPPCGAARRSSGHAEGGPVGPRDLVRLALAAARPAARGIARLRELLGRPSAIAVSITSWRRLPLIRLRAHHREVLGRGLDEHHLGAAGAHLPRLAAQPPARRRRGSAARPVERCHARGGGARRSG